MDPECGTFDTLQMGILSTAVYRESGMEERASGSGLQRLRVYSHLSTHLNCGIYNSFVPDQIHGEYERWAFSFRFSGRRGRYEMQELTSISFRQLDEVVR